MIELKSPTELAALREAGRVVAHALAAAREHAAVGVSLLDLDEIAAKVIADAGATPSFLAYRPRAAPTPYPAVICASVNDAIVHGIPTGYRLADGDLITIDCGAHLDGWCGDAAVSFVVGEPRAADLALIDATERALAAGIAAARPGARLGDVAHAVESVARAAGLGIMADHGGHGVGRAMHEAPPVPNVGRPGTGLPIEPGLVIAIEPMLIANGRDGYRTDADGWTLRTRDGARAAHAEHTIAVTDAGPVILTAP
ncbi:type I methionyl aminopeptidase [Catenuloplanes atrovinosus]|uniref:Methionine aminopeptidase n=1 Tax=Catenuloplanes atrovinosus TaxID=137266 RepID=A0AAE3YLV1_9ACTN|nr:type I methionyl aminopeptidase [Catenuloplanes atrovinosus]MDR7274696.1 methionyl aminopeptidase [Catenuloplanes atrovinosus]